MDTCAFYRLISHRLALGGGFTSLTRLGVMLRCYTLDLAVL